MILSTITITTEMLIAALAVVSAAICVLGARHARRVRSLEAALAKQDRRLQDLGDEFAALLECSRRIGTRLGESDRTQRAMQKQIESLQLGDENQLAVQHAARLLENGWDFKEVTDICELTQGELEILQNLSRHNRAA